MTVLNHWLIVFEHGDMGEIGTADVWVHPDSKAMDAVATARMQGKMPPNAVLQKVQRVTPLRPSEVGTLMEEAGFPTEHILSQTIIRLLENQRKLLERVASLEEKVRHG